MIKRIIDISESAYIHLKQKQLLIDKEKVTVGQIPIEDIGVLILQHPAIVITQQVIIACQKNKVVIIFCDEKRLPYSSILPIAEGNKLHQKIFKEQLNVTEPTRKKLWQQIVIQKIEQQALTLKRLNKNSIQLERIATKVKSADSDNRESVAAVVYWKLLFGNDFIRDTDKAGINALLNYGYSIIRGIIARSICASGLHPSLGLFHHNQYNALCLADDLMEPLRPWVDYLVYQMSQEDTTLEINQQTKTILLNLVNEIVLFKGKKMPLMVSINYLMADLKRCYIKEQKKIEYPKRL
jgi:CRISPR-associated protein Cas1